MTLQSLALVVIGLGVPGWYSAGGVSFYLLLGGVGLPVFAGPAGFGGSTAGYLLGFLVGVAVMAGCRGDAGSSFFRLCLAGVLGIGTVLFMGAAWLVAVTGRDVSLAMLTGVAPFVLKAGVEVPLAAVMVRRARQSDRWRTMFNGL
jgi:biotin transport system substrate-specific component